jgi:TATA-binding protein-associated factor Taf7
LSAGLINRIRDAARLERRIALLADHLQRHPPEETIARTDAPETEAETPEETAEDTTEDDASMAAVAAPVSAALSESADEPQTDETQADETHSDEAQMETADEAGADLSDDARMSPSPKRTRRLTYVACRGNADRRRSRSAL